jgi:hypothetical protein
MIIALLRLDTIATVKTTGLIREKQRAKSRIILYRGLRPIQYFAVVLSFMVRGSYKDIFLMDEPRCNLLLVLV